MIINLFRKLLVGLSFYYKNNLELVKKKDKIILKNIHFRLGKLSKKNQNLKKTHKIFRKKIYDKLETKTNEFDFEFDILCKYAKLKCKITDFPIKYFPRTFAEGKKLRAIKDGMLILKSILKNYIF